MDALTWEALPQRAPRERRRERVEAEAPAAPPSTAKRSREAGDAADGRAHPGSGAGELAEAQLVTVSWREVEDAHQNFECALRAHGCPAAPAHQRPPAQTWTTRPTSSSTPVRPSSLTLARTRSRVRHAGGNTVEEVFGWTALCMFNYMV